MLANRGGGIAAKQFYGKELVMMSAKFFESTVFLAVWRLSSV
jgi:hypothetical protein